MELLLEIIKFGLPAVLMLLLTYVMLTNFMENEENRRMYFLKKETQKSALPVRLQAYERIALFLERISPNSLIVRVPSKGLNVKEYQALLLKSIREEFEYNLAQQMYMSDEAWQMVVTAKSATVSIINKVANDIPGEVPGVELGRKVLEHAMSLNTFPTKGALHFIKDELKREF